MESRNSEELWGKVVARAWSDVAFKERLLADPKGVMKEHGIVFPDGVSVKVIEDSPELVHLILPSPPDELALQELEKVAGGREKLKGTSTTY